MNSKQKIVQGRGGPSNINLGIFVCSLMFTGLHGQNHSPLLTSVKRTTALVDKGHTVFLLINCELKINFITKCQLLYMECPPTTERKQNKNTAFHFTAEMSAPGYERVFAYGNV